GHTDEAALKLVAAGLKDTDMGVKRTALSRLVESPAETALPLLKDLPGDELKPAVETELRSRRLFPFLARGAEAVRERPFPSMQGTNPMVSPDRKWVAYTETGWGRPGGTGGFGRSNLLSVTHVAASDGSTDRIITDMFLVGWMSGSRALASSRD